MKKILFAAALCLAFTSKEKPIMIQDWRLDDFKKNPAGQITYVHYVKIGEPHLMADSDLNKTVHTIINN